jgi:hypothetical protein
MGPLGKDCPNLDSVVDITNGEMQTVRSEDNRRWPARAFGHRGVVLPKEHGAYAEIIFPLITALYLGNGNIASLLLAAAAIAAFLAHESFLVILGERGVRARTQLRAQAMGTAGLLLTAAMTAAALGLWHAPAGVLRAALIPLCATALLVPLIFGRREKTLAGEFLVALIFSSALIPVARAGDVRFHTAMVASSAWFGIFALQTLSVRAVKAHVKTALGMSSPALIVVALSLAVVFAALILAGVRGLAVIPMMAVCPAALVGLACVWLRVHPRHLRSLGWVLVASDLIALAVLMAPWG